MTATEARWTWREHAAAWWLLAFVFYALDKVGVWQTAAAVLGTYALAIVMMLIVGMHETYCAWRLRSMGVPRSGPVSASQRLRWVREDRRKAAYLSEPLSALRHEVFALYCKASEAGNATTADLLHAETVVEGSPEWWQLLWPGARRAWNSHRQAEVARLRDLLDRVGTK